jgi:glycerol-3-phosphate dehydrogenase (NAD(P)+)
MNKIDQPIAVLGAGAWGSALALVLADNGLRVHLWGHNPIDMQKIAKTRENSRYLPGVLFPESITICEHFDKALENAGALLIVVPSHAFTQTLQQIKMHSASHLPIAWGTKGLTQDVELLSSSAQHLLGKDAKLCVLSGPSFASDVAAKKPTAITAASLDKSAYFWQTQLHNDYFRVYTSDDMIGAQLGGACKNVLAIAVGIADGLDLGRNARAALMTRGFAEIRRLGNAMHAKESTLMGLSGIGDLILTCTENESRNRRFGFAIGKGEALADIRRTIGQVIEGEQTAQLIYQLAQTLNVSMPITEQVYNILYQGQDAAKTVQYLLMREAKDEVQ